jgi:hypothetical protein
VPPWAWAAHVQQHYAQGGRVDYRIYPNRDHVGVGKLDSPLIPDLMHWTQDRIDGKEAQSPVSGKRPN